MDEGTQYQREYVACNLCGRTDSSLLFADTELSSSRERGIVRCLHCGLVYRNIRRTQEAILKEYAQKEYCSISKDWMEGRREVFRPYEQMISAFRKNNRILDVGAGHGFFLKMCAERGWNYHGVEISREAVDFARRELGLNLSCCTLEQACYHDIFFDVVTFWNVLGYLLDPKGTLQETYRVLRPGGAVVIRDPNADFHIRARKVFTTLAGIAPLFRAIDQTVFHLYSFDRHTLSRMLSDTGFENIQVLPASLSWTTTHDVRSSHIKKLIANAVGIITNAVYLFTRKRALLSPSMLAIATKLTDAAPGCDEPILL